MRVHQPTMFVLALDLGCAHQGSYPSTRVPDDAHREEVTETTRPPQRSRGADALSTRFAGDRAQTASPKPAFDPYRPIVRADCADAEPADLPPGGPGTEDPAAPGGSQLSELSQLMTAKDLQSAARCAPRDTSRTWVPEPVPMQGFRY